MLKIISFIKPNEWMHILLVNLIAILQVYLSMMIPHYMRRITTLVQAPESQMSEIAAAGGLMILCTLGALICVFIIGFFASRTSAALSMRLREMLFSKVGDFSMEEFSRFSTGSLIARSTNDVTQVQQFVMSALQMMLRIPILTIGGFIGIARTGAHWTIAALIAFCFVILVIIISMLVVMPQFKKMQSLVDKLNITVRESLVGRHVVRAYNAEDFHEERFETANSGFTNADRYANRAMAVMNPVMSLGTDGLTIAVYVIGAFLIWQMQYTEALVVFSNMIVMSFYLRLLFDAVKFTTKIVPRIPRAMVSAGRIVEVLETEPAIMDGELKEGLPGIVGEITFKNVGFRYTGAGANALENISFTATQGETVAFIGSTGSGKTTLINLVMRFFDATEGEVLINGVNVKEYNLEALNNKIGYIPQKSVLFKGSVSSNVAYGENGKGGYSTSDIERAIRIANAEEFVTKLSDGIDSEISQRGANLSGGQKQRLSIARAIFRNPEILIFDDSFSALDYKTDGQLRRELKTDTLTSAATKLIIAQRIGTIMDADQIIVLDGGKIAGVGTHAELMKSCKVYQEIAKTQLSEEVMAS